MSEISTIADALPYLLTGTVYTVAIAVFAIFFGTVFGVIAGLLRFAPSLMLRRVVGWIVEFVRAIPMLLLLFFVFFALPLVVGIDLTTFPAAVLAISLWMMANTSEVVRGGIQSIPYGQTEAARSTGLSSLQVMRYVVFPQAIRRMLPSYVGICIQLTKDTSLAAIIGAFELTRATQETIARTYLSLEFYLIAAAIYFCICFPLSLLGRKLEARLQ